MHPVQNLAQGLAWDIARACNTTYTVVACLMIAFYCYSVMVSGLLIWAADESLQ